MDDPAPAADPVPAESDVPDGGEDTEQSAPQESAHVGDPITVTDMDGGSMSAKVKKVVDPLPVGEYDETMEPGHHFVGVYMSIRNNGDSTLDECPDNNATLLLSTDEQVDTTSVSGGPAGDSSFSCEVKLLPGARRQGWLAFEVKDGAKVSGMQFTPDSGFGDDTAEWKL
jgi:Domain of unknown function (DUF4352)